MSLFLIPTDDTRFSTVFTASRRTRRDDYFARAGLGSVTGSRGPARGPTAILERRRELPRVASGESREKSVRHKKSLGRGIGEGRRPTRLTRLTDKIHHVGRESYFVNDNVALVDTRQEAVQELARRMVDPPGTLRVLMDSLAFGALKPLAGAEEVINRHQLELTADVMGHSLWLTGNTLHVDGGENIVG